VTAPLRSDVIAIPHTVVLVRHGETDWNVARRLQGHEDIPLNDRGRAQARRHGAALASRCARLGTRPDDLLFIASPLSRASETMRILRRELGLEPDAFRRDPRLVELGFGRWAGLTLPEVERGDPHGYAERLSKRWDARPPGGESMADGALRVAPLLREIDRPAVIVTHGGLIRVIHALVGIMERPDAWRLPTPQDRYHVLSGGRADRE
jgi:broad specificity phosphatase PhoE